MSMKRIQLEVSSDIFDKIISFLEMLPKQKVHIKISNNTNDKQVKKESLIDFFRNSPLVGIEIERSKETYESRIKF